MRPRLHLSLSLRGCALLAAALLLSACGRSTPPPPAEDNEVDADENWQLPPPVPLASPQDPAVTPKPLLTRNVYATWYDVPDDSLAKRRGDGEFTAAHNRLPIGTHVRVTDLQNGKSVTVRITDRGIPGHKTRLDLCKEAAEAIGMVRAGRVRVRMEVLAPEEPKGAPVAPSSPAQP